MIKEILSVLKFEAFDAKNDDPGIHFKEKVMKRPFMFALLGHQHIRYALAQFRGKKGWIGKPTTAFCENFLTADVDTPWVSEMFAEIKQVRTVLIGLNIPFSNMKIYEKDMKYRDAQKLFDTKLEQEVGKTFEKQTQYFLYGAHNQIYLNGVDREKVLKPIEKFKKWGFEVVAAFPYPSALLAHLGRMELDWDSPCIFVCYLQRMLFFMGWHKGEILTVRSKLISEGARTATGSRPMLNAVQKEIDLTTNFVEGKAGKPVQIIYTHNDRLDPAFAGIEGLYKNTKPVQWDLDHCEFEIPTDPQPDLSLIFTE